MKHQLFGSEKDGQVRKTGQQKHSYPVAEEFDGSGKWLFTVIPAAADQAAVQSNRPDVKVLFSPEGFSSARISFRISNSN